MDKKQTYITDEEKINCQKVTDAFAEFCDNDDLIILNAGRYGFVKLQYFKFPSGFDTVDNFYDSKSLFHALWEEWLHAQLIHLSANTPMADIVDYTTIMKCLPREKQKELLDRRLYFAEKTGIPDLWSEEYRKTGKAWSRDWEQFDWKQVREKLSRVEKEHQEGKKIEKFDMGLSLDEFKEYFEWLYDMHPNLYFKVILCMASENISL